MSKGRLEAFSDGVIAILITIMVLELQIPHEADADALRPLVPVFVSYVLSFVIVGIYWNNHHHMLQVTERINGRVLWANLHLLFWLSLFPFFTGWMGENDFSALPTAAYGGVLLMAAIAYYILQRSILAAQGPDSTRRRPGPGPEGQDLPRPLPRRHPTGVRQPVDRLRPLRGRRPHVARARPPVGVGGRTGVGQGSSSRARTSAIFARNSSWVMIPRSMSRWAETSAGRACAGSSA